MAAFVQHQESETFLLLRGSFQITCPSLPTHTAAGHQATPSPSSQPPSAWEEKHIEASGVGVQKKRGEQGSVTERLKRPRLIRSLRSLWVAKKKRKQKTIRIRCSVIKKQMSQWRPCLDASLCYCKWHTAAVHTSPDRTPTCLLQRDENTHTHTQPSPVGPPRIEKRPLLKCIAVEVTT